mgnify:CR=1 FL=1
MKNKPYFPMFIDLSDKNIVVAGGGNIATRRIKTLLKFTRNITVVATKVTQELMDLGKAGTVTLYIRPVKRSDFANAYMVIAATNDWKLNDEIHRVCKEEGIYVNVASDREACDFYFPGVYGSWSYSQRTGSQKSKACKGRDPECAGKSTGRAG